MNYWPLAWSHGHGQVEALGGMLGPVHFQLRDGRKVQPFAVFPWADEALPANQQALTGLMSRGRGEWPCVPFGLNPDAEALGWPHPIHGTPAHSLWQRLDDGRNPASLHLAFVCDDTSPIHRLERRICGVPGQARIECELVVHVRRACALPIGLHPTLRMPQRPGALRIEPGRFAFARSYPYAVEPGADVVAPDCEFTDLSAVPRAGGGSIDLRAFPLAEQTESLVQLCGINGHMAASNLDENYHVRLAWDAQLLPSCMLWISNAGRRDWPWQQRHFALGLEPVCAAFDLGVLASTGPNPISARGVATSLQLQPGAPLTLRYAMTLE